METGFELAQKPSVSGGYKWFSGCLESFGVKGKSLETPTKVRALPWAPGLDVFHLGWALKLTFKVTRILSSFELKTKENPRHLLFLESRTPSVKFEAEC